MIRRLSLYSILSVLLTGCGERQNAEFEDLAIPIVASYVRLFADAAGESHFEDLEVDLVETDFAPPAGPLFIGQFASSSASYWIGAYPNWDGEEPHPTPQRQILVTVRGEYEVSASDGETRRFPVGSVLLLEDTFGEGHTTRMTSEETTLVFAVNKTD